MNHLWLFKSLGIKNQIKWNQKIPSYGFRNFFKKWGATTTTIRFTFKAQCSGLLKLSAVNFSFPIETVYRIQMLKKGGRHSPIRIQFWLFYQTFSTDIEVSYSWVSNYPHFYSFLGNNGLKKLDTFINCKNILSQSYQALGAPEGIGLATKFFFK